MTSGSVELRPSGGLREPENTETSLEGLRLQRAVAARLFDTKPEPLRVGRFVIIDRLGEGAMGVVYRAFDPELGRPIALKLSRQSVALEGRMMREAQALARLSHPNVVTIHEVGTHGDRLFLAMELVQGLPLHRWCAEHRRPGRRWATRVEGLLEQAARGLRAAHAAGVVHRDLKPSNILVGEDGRLRLVDFGLARTETGTSETELVDTGLEPSVGADETATVPGGWVGTPAYMAPEQFDGHADEQSDQFGLCATFFEVLHGVRAYTGADYAQLEDNLRAERMTEPPARVGPTYLHQALRRGLSHEPSQRHQSIADLLQALERGRKRRGARWLAAGGLLLLGLLVGSWWSLGPRAKARCSGARSQLAGVWDDARRADVERGLRESSLPYAVAVWERVAPRLDAYVDVWVEQHTEVCEATAVRREQSHEVMDRRMRCLHRAKIELSAVSGQLVTADPSTVQYAYRLMDALPPLSRCADVERLMAEVSPPEPEAAESVAALRAEVAQARTLRIAGRYDDAVARFESLVPRTDAVGYAPLQAELALEHGKALSHANRYEDAEHRLEWALRSSLGLGQWNVAIDAVSMLVFVVGERMGRPDEGLAFAQTGWGLLEHAPDPVLESSLRGSVAQIMMDRGESVAAEAELRRALAVAEPALPARHEKIGLLHNDLGNSLRDQGRLDEAEAELRRALDLFVAKLGPGHPFVGAVHINLANVLKAKRTYPEAEAELREALRILSEALGPDHLDLAISHLSLGNVLRRQKRYDEAAEEYRRAEQLYTQVLGPENPRTLGAGMNLILVLYSKREYAEAEALGRALLPRLIRSVGPDHFRVADARFNLGNAILGQGRLDEAQAEYHQALAIYESAPEPKWIRIAELYDNLGLLLERAGRLEEAEVQMRRASATYAKLDEHDFAIARSRARLARVLRARGDPDDEALALAEQAHAALTGDDVFVPDSPNAALVLARALWRDPSARARARAVVRQAWVDLEGARPPGPALRSELAAWLDEHPSP
ncbi:MAG: serine/threonine-protein kinase [Myxococcota bacterium]